MNKAYIAGLLVVAIALGFTLWAFAGSIAPYVDIRTARQMGTDAQVRGKILHDTVRYDAAAGILRFRIEDKNRDQIDVVYHGAKPESFDTAPDTAVEGIVKASPAGGADYLASDKMAIKCPSKYDDKGKSPYAAPKQTGGSV